MSEPVDAASYAVLRPGDPAPWFRQRTFENPKYTFDTAAGRYLVLCFFGSAADPRGQSALQAVMAHRDRFDEDRFCFFGVSIDPQDETEGRIREILPGIRFFLDHDLTVSRLYGAVPRDQSTGSVAIRQCWVIVDPTLRVMAVFPLGPEPDRAVFDYVDNLPHPSRFAGFEVPAPILVLPNVFEPGLCKELIRRYEADGGQETGFMREVDGRTVVVNDHRHKRRRDYEIEDRVLIKELQARIRRRVAPEIVKVHCFKATRMERYIVSCYAAEDGGHFYPHRDNTTKGTAHRRFAVSINLNAEFEGGELMFPEYGQRTYKAPPGGAVVFAGALLHAVTLVTSGRRYAFLPFLYDEEAARLRETNAQFVAGDGASYRSGPRTAETNDVSPSAQAEAASSRAPSVG